VSIFAAIQMASGSQLSANLLMAERLVSDAVEAGARMVVLPENFAFIGKQDKDIVGICEEPGSGPLQDFFAELAQRHAVWVCGGTIPLKSPDSDRVYGASLIYDDQGRQVSRYDKIHLFDVQLIDSDEQYNESANIYSGQETVVTETPFGRVGMAVCYDLRFPELFRELITKGAEIILLPAAFTALTGKAHWEVLLRARAIENLCYIVAAAQGGFHMNGRSTYGHSMIVDPWGGVTQLNTTTPGFITAEVKIDYLHSTRRSFPALEHRRLS
jgi:nitrilase